MLTLLLVIVLSGKSFDVTPKVCIDTSVTVTVAKSNVELVPVHMLSIWPSFYSLDVKSTACNDSTVERTACNDSTQDKTYFK